MATYEYTPQEDARFDHLTDAENHTYGEARAIIMRERQAALARQTLRAVSQPEPLPEPEMIVEPELVEALVVPQRQAPQKQRHYSRRGGRSYPEPSDSELDPYWNGKAETTEYIQSEENEAAFQEFITNIHNSAAETLARTEKISYDHAVALLRSRKGE